MKLRTALKICRDHFGHRYPPVFKRHKRQTIWTAKEIGRRKWLDRRFPYINTEEEDEMMIGFVGSVLIEALVDDPDRRRELQDQFYEEMAR